MKQYVQEVLDVAKNYGLQILTLDFTDVTLLCRLEILPEIYTQTTLVFLSKKMADLAI